MQPQTCHLNFVVSTWIPMQKLKCAHTPINYRLQRIIGELRSCLDTSKNSKLYKILHHIKSCSIYMEH
jgi:flagellin-specific chaperone FliS